MLVKLESLFVCFCTLGLELRFCSTCYQVCLNFQLELGRFTSLPRAQQPVLSQDALRLQCAVGIPHDLRFGAPLQFKFKKTNTTLAHYTIQEGSCLPARTEGLKVQAHLVASTIKPVLCSSGPWCTGTHMAYCSRMNESLH